MIRTFLLLFRVDELYDLVLRTQSVGKDVLPAVVDRLEALQGLHQQGRLFFSLAVRSATINAI